MGLAGSQLTQLGQVAINGSLTINDAMGPPMITDSQQFVISVMTNLASPIDGTGTSDAVCSFQTPTYEVKSSSGGGYYKNYGYDSHLYSTALCSTYAITFTPTGDSTQDIVVRVFSLFTVTGGPTDTMHIY